MQGSHAQPRRESEEGRGGGDGSPGAGEGEGEEFERHSGFLRNSLAAMRKQVAKAISPKTSLEHQGSLLPHGSMYWSTYRHALGGSGATTEVAGGGAGALQQPRMPRPHSRARRDKGHAARNALLTRVNTSSLGPVLEAPPGVEYLLPGGRCWGSGVHMHAV